MEEADEYKWYLDSRLILLGGAGTLELMDLTAARKEVKWLAAEVDLSPASPSLKHSESFLSAHK